VKSGEAAEVRSSGIGSRVQISNKPMIGLKSECIGSKTAVSTKEKLVAVYSNQLRSLKKTFFITSEESSLGC
jgi:hypothetical protein